MNPKFSGQVMRYLGKGALLLTVGLLYLGGRWPRWINRSPEAPHEAGKEPYRKVPWEQKTLEKMISAHFSGRDREGWPGKLKDMPATVVMPDFLYHRWLDQLRLFDKGWRAVIFGHERTDYYQWSRKDFGVFNAKVRVARFWRLYRSVKKTGFAQGFPGKPVILLVEGDTRIRIDGAHRSAILRHLGVKSLAVHVLRGSDLAGFPVTSDDQRRAIGWFLAGKRPSGVAPETEGKIY